MDLIELIKSIDIVDYISQYVDLEQRGDEWWGLSCFKEEKTPSFSVRKDPPFFYDYSSGVSGNVYSFTKKYFKCSSIEAIEELKKYAGYDGEITVPKNRLSLLSVMKKYAPITQDRKKSANIVLPDDYMLRYEKRDDKLQVWRDEGISDESLDKYQVRYDAVSDRIVYPLRNMDMRIANVGGRALDPHWKDKGQRKYCYFFPWGTVNTIYGVPENMDAINEKKEVIIFEGCKSVLLADTWGFHNTGALLTSHLSSKQLVILASLGVDVVFALDNEIRIRDDKNIQKLKNYVNVYYLWDRDGVLGEKDAPVDKGKEVFQNLYRNKYRLR